MDEYEAERRVQAQLQSASTALDLASLAITRAKEIAQEDPATQRGLRHGLASLSATARTLLDLLSESEPS